MAKQLVIQSLEEKMMRLIDDNRRLRQECGHLAQVRDKQLSDNRKLMQTVQQLEKRVATLELSQGLTGSNITDKKAAKARINRLMREIDRCIALMNRQ